MAVETKVGLLVGLAFIVCVGIILTHRGSGDRISSDVALELLSKHHATSLGSAGVTFRSFTGRRSPGRPPAGWRRSHNSTGLILPKPKARGASNQAVPAGADFTNDPHPAFEKAQPRATSAGGSMTYPEWEKLFSDEQAGLSESTRDAPADPPPAIEQQEDQRPVHKPVPKPARRRVPARYVVRSGDTMWGIARKAYGKASRGIVDAIFAANRDRLTSVDRLKIGVELTLPVIDGVGGPGASDREKVTSLRPARGQPAKRSARFYDG